MTKRPSSRGVARRRACGAFGGLRPCAAAKTSGADFGGLPTLQFVKVRGWALLEGVGPDGPGSRIDQDLGFRRSEESRMLLAPATVSSKGILR